MLLFIPWPDNLTAMHLSGRHVRRLIRSLQETEAETLSFWTLKRSGNLPKHLIEIQKRRKRLASRHAPPLIRHWWGRCYLFHLVYFIPSYLPLFPYHTTQCPPRPLKLNSRHKLRYFNLLWIWKSRATSCKPRHTTRHVKMLSICCTLLTLIWIGLVIYC